ILTSEAGKAKNARPRPRIMRDNPHSLLMWTSLRLPFDWIRPGKLAQGTLAATGGTFDALAFSVFAIGLWRGHRPRAERYFAELGAGVNQSERPAAEVAVFDEAECGFFASILEQTLARAEHH